MGYCWYAQRFVCDSRSLFQMPERRVAISLSVKLYKSLMCCKWASFPGSFVIDVPLKDSLAMGSFSLFELPSDGFGVTELIKSLIQIISYDIYDVKRNVLSIYHVIEGARDLYKEINNFLALAESDDGNNWENFDKFTKAIDPLEG